MAELRIRAAFLSDEDELAEMDRDMWSPLHSVQAKPTEPYDPFFTAGTRLQEYLVAEVDGRVAGYIRVARPTRLAANAHVRQIQGLLVGEWAQGRGVARALLRAAAEQSRAQGARRLTLRVLSHNAPARRLYEAEGFSVEGVLPGELLLDGEYVDDVLMGRFLTD